MGRERSRSGKQVYLCLAGLILSVVAGCTTPRQTGSVPREQDETRAALVRGQKLLAQGDYNGSLKENQRVLSLSPGQPPADEAIFNMGLVYAHSENPKKDYRRSLGLFRRVINEFPQSQLVEQARAWVGVLQTNERLNQMIQKSQQVDIEIEQKKRAKEK